MALSAHAIKSWARSIDRVIAGLFVGSLAWVTWHLGGMMADAMAWGYVAAMLAVPLVWVRWLLVEPTGRPSGWWWPLPMVLYVAWHVASLSATPGRAAMEGLHLLWMLTGFWIALHVVRLKEPRSWVLVGMGLITLIAVGMAFYQRAVDPGWLPMGRRQVGQYLSRSGGPFGAPNNFAAWLIVVLPPAWWLTWRGLRRGDRRALAAGVVATAASAALVLTISRGGWIAMALAVMAWILVGRNGSRWRRVLGAVGLAAMLFAAVGVSYVTLPAVKDRIDHMVAYRGERTRPFMWEAAWKLWQDHRVWGSGGGSYDVLMESYRPIGFRDSPGSAHSDYLNVLSDYGLVGFGLSWGLAGVVLFRVGAAHRRVRQRHIAGGLHAVPGDGWKTAVGVGILGALVATVVDFHLRIPAVAWLLALAVAEWTVGRQRGEEIPTEQVRHNWGGLAQVSLLAVLAVGSTVWAWPLYGAAQLRFDASERIRTMADEGQPERMQRDGERVLAELRRAVALDPRHEEGWSELSMALALQAYGRPGDAREIGQEAEAAARRALALSEEVAWHWVRLGVALDLQGRWSEAGLCFGRAVKMAPMNAQVWFYQGFHFSLKPTTRALARSALATCLRLDGRMHQAEALRAALE